ncbi:MAG: tetratricopeptide repeat protein [Pseudomonadota bacterium]
MSDTDSFIREVEEEVRQDRMLQYWKRYGVFIIGGIALIVAASAGFALWEQQQRDAAAENGRLLLQAGESDPATVAAIQEEVGGEAKVLAALRAAQAQAEAGDRTAAITGYASVAADAALPERYRQLARLEAVRLRAVLGEGEAVLAELDELSLPDQPFRPLALELRAVIRLNAGDVAGAREDLTTLMSEPGATGETRARAQSLLRTLPAEEG